MLIELLVWITPPMTTVPPSVTRTCVVACCVISVGLPLTGAAKVRRRVLDVDVQEDGAFRGDLRNHSQSQEGIDIGYGWRAAQLRLSHDGHAHALANQSLDVVLGYDPRTGQDFEQVRETRPWSAGHRCAPRCWH